MSCSTYEPLSIDVLIPAKHSLQPEIKSVVLIDNSLLFRGEKIHEIILPSETYEVDTIWKDDFAQIVLDGLKYELEQRSFFDSVYVHPDPLKRSGLVKGHITWEIIDAICKKYNAEAVVSVDDYLYHTKIEVKKVHDGNLFALMDASAAVLLRTYNSLNRTVEYKEIYRDTISWDAYGGSMAYIAAQLPPLKSALADLANYMGEKAADDIAPYWQEQKRGFYNSGNIQFMQATEYVRSENWGEAIKVWKYVFDHAKTKVKSRAAYNLALASEILGDYESANYWINEGLGALSGSSGGQVNVEKKRLKLYSVYMTQRLKVLDELKIQVGDGE